MHILRTCPQLPPSSSSYIASVDVEWTKNYRIRNGNRPFCFSCVWVDVPAQKILASDSTLRFHVYAAYVDRDNEVARLAGAAIGLLANVMSWGHVLVGHQLCSDLSVLARASRSRSTDIAKVRSAWARRRAEELGRVFDTRFDMTSLPRCRSRRLVDVCEAVKLGVAQPEIRGSMTAMQREYTKSGDRDIRERLTVMNIRHALSAALLYLWSSERLVWQHTLNVNRIIHANLTGRVEYVGSRDFAALL